MDPSDIPSTITVVNCLPYWGTIAFGDAFLTELSEHEDSLPLQALCISGGHPSSDGWAELDDLQIGVEKEGIVAGGFAVSFDEVSPTGCRDVAWTDKRCGRIDFTLRLGDGYVEFLNPMPRREYDPEEF